MKELEFFKISLECCFDLINIVLKLQYEHGHSPLYHCLSNDGAASSTEK